MGKNYGKCISTLLTLLAALMLSEAAAELKVSLITCWPGKEVYELYGHTALRIRGTDGNNQPFDSVWNYGMFDFLEPNFVGRFVKGEMMYQVGGYPFEWFMPEYVSNGRRVEEQTLNLTQPQAEALRKALQINALPQNRVYLYDYVKDNCSTRVWDQIDKAAGGVTLPAGQFYPTYRQAMRAYHSHYPWYSLGIDLALAYPVDTAISNSDQIFLPIVLHDKVADAVMSNGQPLVSNTTVLWEGAPDATLPPTPWYASPVFAGWLLVVIAAACFIFCRRRLRVLNWFMALFYGMTGLMGCIIAFLVFFSIHRAASPNLLLTWINPLALIVPLLVWSRRTRPIAVAYLTAQAIALLFVAVIWPFQTQCGNAAMLPIALTEMISAVSYSLLFFKNRNN